MQDRPTYLNNQPHKTSNKKVVARFIFAALILFLAVLLFVYRQNIIDTMRVRQFVVSPALSAMMDRSQLSDIGKFFVKASETRIVDKRGFNEACSSLQNEKTVILGCYTTQAKHIYVYDVQDERLDGVREATLAHEMLHAAYDRLSETERQRVGGLLEEEAAKITDERLLQLIAFYKESEPTEVTNELHSILGTEVRGLSSELEDYYKKYFIDRSVVVGLKEKYEEVFTGISTRQLELVAEMEAISAQVEVDQKDYLRQLDRLNKDITTFNTWADSPRATPSEFYTRRSALEGRIATLESMRSTINNEIEAYNTKRSELQELNILAEDLNRSLDSKITPLPTTPSL